MTRSCRRGAARGDEAEAQGRGRLLIRGVEGGDLGREFGVNLRAVIVEVAQGGVDFARREVRVLANDFLGRPAVANVVGGDLRDADARKPIQPGDVIGAVCDVRVVKRGHGRSVARGYGKTASSSALRREKPSTSGMLIADIRIGRTAQS